MRLSAILPEAAGGPDPDIGSLAYDDREVAPGTLFFCVPGFSRDGHDFAPDAVARGAAALVVERPLGLGTPEVEVASVRAAMAPAAARFHGDPSAELGVVGITGTNGKTTSAFLVRHLLEATGTRSGLLGTIASVVAGREQPAVRTTPEALELQRAFRAMADGGDEACVLEVSSHALELGRADAVHWDVAVFTNLTHEHLDFHPDMDAYFAAKRKLFTADPRVRVVNFDDPYGARLAGEFPGTVTVGIDQDADWRARDVESGAEGARFTAETPDGTYALACPLPGAFNVLNALGALAAARALGAPMDALARALPGAPPVPGRFQAVPGTGGVTVLVDYSHKPDALENVLRAARGMTAGRLVCVFGCGGDRDRAKRPLMGEVASRLADRVIVTSDNPRSEDPEAIIDEVLGGAGPDAEREPDRRRAIARALEGVEAGDVVLVAGKGHETYQELAGGVTVPFDDAAVVREEWAAGHEAARS